MTGPRISSTVTPDRTRPYQCTVHCGPVQRTRTFTTERERDLYAAQARADLALNPDRIEGKDR